MKSAAKTQSSSAVKWRSTACFPWVVVWCSAQQKKQRYKFRCYQARRCQNIASYSHTNLIKIKGELLHIFQPIILFRTMWNNSWVSSWSKSNPSCAASNSSVTGHDHSAWATRLTSPSGAASQFSPPCLQLNRRQHKNTNTTTWQAEELKP